MGSTSGWGITEQILRPEPSPTQMVQELDIALHGETWARVDSPMQVWDKLLDEIRELRWKAEA